MLIDDLKQLAHDFPQVTAERIGEDLIERLRSAVAFHIQDIANYLYFGSDQEVWKPTDFPNIAPVYPVAWFEWRMPTKMRSKEHTDSQVVTLDETTRRLVGTSVDMPLGNMPRLGALATSRDSRHDPALQARLEGTGARWVTIMDLFGQIDSRDIHSSFFAGTLIYGVDEHGGYIDGSKLNGMFGIDRDYSNGESNGNGLLCFAPKGIGLFDKEDVEHLAYHAYVPMLALMTLHCRQAVFVDGNVKPPHEQKGRVKKGKLPLVQYKTLTIDAIRKILKTVTGSDNLSAKALHLCHAHWKVYDNGKGLFGKHKGTYFWSVFERGKKEAGTVIKSYDVKAPSPPE